MGRQANMGYVHLYFQVDARSDRTGEVIFKDNFKNAVAGVVQVITVLCSARQNKKANKDPVSVAYQ